MQYFSLRLGSLTGQFELFRDRRCFAYLLDRAVAGNKITSLTFDKVRMRFLQNPELSAKRNDGAGKGVATDGSEPEASEAVQALRQEGAPTAALEEGAVGATAQRRREARGGEEP